MLHIVQFSGGAGSALAAKMVIDQSDKEDVVLLFHDTKAEDQDAYRFRAEVSEFLGVPITEVSDGRDLWQVIDDNHALPSDRMPFCTRILKQEQGANFLKTIREEFIVYNGFDREEWQRVQRATLRGEVNGYAVKSPVFEANLTSGQAKQIIVSQWGIALPRAYQHLSHNNCIPCFKAGRAYWHKIWRYYPEQFAKAKDYETRLGYTVFKDVSLADLERVWSRSDQLPLFDEDGIPCMCAV